MKESSAANIGEGSNEKHVNLRKREKQSQLLISRQKLEMATTCSIPMIDLHDFPNQSSKLMAACEEWGCFRLLNHHDILPSTLMSEMNSVAKSLFDLPVEIKRRNLDVVIGSGYTAGTEKSPLYEAMGMYDIPVRYDVETFCSQLDATPHQREIITKYVGAVHELLMSIAEKLAEGFGVKSENIGFQNWMFQFRMNKYHFTPQTVGLTGVETHTDSGFIYIVQIDEGVCGLEVMDKSGHFIPVDPHPGTIIVNLGDIAKVWSNGRFCNVKHRVQCKEPTIRLSIASGLLGPREAIEPLAELVNIDHPCVYVPTTYEDYRKFRFSKDLQAGEALVLQQTSSFVN
ncbi:hypothetical protein OSB04_027781 [Centaurea solstitialis]|uniref:2-oxoglutarate-dependent dioxygenase DAO n=1 Tax=Centaurea solstitialis TaxID=347529 RepID=A0AA38SEH2_9ASTR|nr:hypothetical protein OSB04_027781 [Centaurea solstitialis]